MRIGKTRNDKRRKFEAQKEWHEVFAYLPHQCIETEQILWLERIFRRNIKKKSWHTNEWQYLAKDQYLKLELLRES